MASLAEDTTAEMTTEKPENTSFFPNDTSFFTEDTSSFSQTFMTTSEQTEQPTTPTSVWALVTLLLLPILLWALFVLIRNRQRKREEISLSTNLSQEKPEAVVALSSSVTSDSIVVTSERQTAATNSREDHPTTFHQPTTANVTSKPVRVASHSVQNNAQDMDEGPAAYVNVTMGTPQLPPACRKKQRVHYVNESVLSSTSNSVPSSHHNQAASSPARKKPLVSPKPQITAKPKPQKSSDQHDMCQKGSPGQAYESLTVTSTPPETHPANCNLTYTRISLTNDSNATSGIAEEESIYEPYEDNEEDDDNNQKLYENV